MVRVGPTMAIPELLLEHGVEPGALLSQFGLEPDTYQDPDNKIPFATSCRLLARCAEYTGCPHFGLLVGQRSSLSSLGPLGFLMMSSPDVRTALDTVARHFHLHNSGAAISLLEQDSCASLSFTILQSDIRERQQVSAGVLAVKFKLMRKLCGPDWQASGVHFAHRRPQDPGPFMQFFEVPPVFNAGANTLKFPSRWLDKPLASADPYLHSMMLRRVHVLESQFEEDLVGQLRRLLPSLIAARKATLAVAAQHVRMGARTLGRRLAAEGTTFRALCNEARHVIACRLLADTDMPANQIADCLGYANASAFTHAFHRWSVVGPAEWRVSAKRRERDRSRARARRRAK
jgi:AraC-like DNA-binding protein